MHFWHIYHLSPSYILIAPERITVPLSVRRIPRCLTRTVPILGKVSNHIQTHTHTMTHIKLTISKQRVETNRRAQRGKKKKTRAFERGTADVYTNMNEFLLNHTFATFQIPQYNLLYTQAKHTQIKEMKLFLTN